MKPSDVLGHRHFSRDYLFSTGGYIFSQPPLPRLPPLLRERSLRDTRREGNVNWRVKLIVLGEQ
jgi:hypothetical protein